MMLLLHGIIQGGSQSAKPDKDRRPAYVVGITLFALSCATLVSALVLITRS